MGELFDRFILIKVNEYGFDSWHKIKREATKCKLFWNNWWLRSKTESEIKKRCYKLLDLLVFAEEQKKKKRQKTQKKKILSNKTPRKRLTKKFIEELVETLTPNKIIKVYDEFDDRWNKCRVIKHCDKDKFTLLDLGDDGTFDESFKNLKFEVLDKEDDDDDDIDIKSKTKKNKKKRMDKNKKMQVPKAKR